MNRSKTFYVDTKRNSCVRNLVGTVLHLFLPTFYRVNDGDLFGLCRNLFTCARMPVECPSSFRMNPGLLPAIRTVWLEKTGALIMYILFSRFFAS